ncbi:LOW QUALITY PROTEIN: hypothetical protein IG631_22100 [Alternaria alternata]|nr:LOW QUALITY PROTEIN: hypothetical protein IG631_22100 [Alternaria alternata]
MYKAAYSRAKFPSFRAGRCCSPIGAAESKLRNSHGELGDVFDMHLQARSVRSDRLQRIGTKWDTYIAPDIPAFADLDRAAWCTGCMQATAGKALFVKTLTPSIMERKTLWAAYCYQDLYRDRIQ